ncbi:hypothetical protein ABBQ32_009133 [Trebouxia sp. C0010 RCD-2024]
MHVNLQSTVVIICFLRLHDRQQYCSVSSPAADRPCPAAQSNKQIGYWLSVLTCNPYWDPLGTLPLMMGLYFRSALQDCTTPEPHSISLVHTMPYVSQSTNARALAQYIEENNRLVFISCHLGFCHIMQTAISCQCTHNQIHHAQHLSRKPKTNILLVQLSPTRQV